MSKIKSFIDSLSREDLAAFEARTAWVKTARDAQLFPNKEYYINLLCAGRAYGKTRSAAEQVWWWAYKDPGSRTAVIAPTHGDLIGINFEGKSGLIRVMPPEIIRRYVKSPYPVIELINDSLILGYSAEDPRRLRGPEHARIWGDEFCSWQRIQETFDMAMFGLRLGDNPQMLLTTTPKPHKILRDLIDRHGDDVFVTTGSTYDNVANLPAKYVNQLKAKYEGTQLGRQEMYAEILTENENAIIKRAWFKMWPYERDLPQFQYIVQSYDTAFTEKTEGDATAFTCWGIFFLDNGKSEKGYHCAMLLDAWGEKLSFPELREKAIDEYNSGYGPSEKTVDVVLIEDKGSGISLRQELKRSGVPVIAYNPGRADKQQRAHAISHVVSNGRVFIPESNVHKGEFARWAHDLLDQICNFPMEGMHDDYVDSFTQAMKLLANQTWLTEQEETEYDYSYQEPVSNPYAV